MANPLVWPYLTTVDETFPHLGNPFTNDPLGIFTLMLHVLLVEDNPADVLMVREAIRTSPVMSDVLIAYDGKQARHFLNDFRFEPDLVFLDLKVPLFNSFEFLEQLRANQGPPVVVLTASLNPEDTQHAIKAGAKEFIVKPSDMDEFLNVVRAALARWSVEDAEREVHGVVEVPRRYHCAMPHAEKRYTVTLSEHELGELMMAVESAQNICREKVYDAPHLSQSIARLEQVYGILKQALALDRVIFPEDREGHQTREESETFTDR
jgi:DNA-binding response OmpR family regulator